MHEIPIFGDIIHFFWGVPIFFTLSGFLIWQSIGRSKTFGEYCRKRFWRIYPELWVAVLIELVVILLLNHQPLNWPQFGLFAVGQGTIFQFWTPDCLRGYGCGCPNGALWTICVLIQFYFFAYFLYKLLHNKGIVRWIITIIIFALISYFTPFLKMFMPETVGKLYDMTLFSHLWMFLVAACFAEYKDKVLPFVIKYWWIFILANLLFKYGLKFDLPMGENRYGLICTLTLLFGLVGFAYRFPVFDVKRDISYGVYIYHMTVINAAIALGFSGTPLCFIVVLLITCSFAWLSAKYIGEFSKKMKYKTR